MNFRYWDKHKFASVLAMVLVITFYAVYFIVTSPMEDKAWERAAEKLTYEEAKAAQKYIDYHDTYLSSKYHTWNSISGYILLAGILMVIYSGLSSFYIPERYQKKEEKITQEL